METCTWVIDSQIYGGGAYNVATMIKKLKK